MLEEFRQTLIDAAPLIRNCQTVFRIGPESWVIDVAGGPPLTLWADKRLARVVLSSSIGRPTAELSASTCEVAMVFNGLWRETFGQRFALEEPGGDIEFLLEAPIGLGPDELVAVIEEYSERSRCWRELMETHGGLDAEEHSEALAPLMTVGIRV